MSELAPLISDLALILICAGVMTLVFKRLKQPLVLGYIVAGFLASPHVPLTPSVIDVANIHTWSEIGVIFLLFALGLEFSFKKLVKVGGTAVIAACTIIFCMILVGIFVGWSFGWQRMDCLYLGGMLAMSSTTIIYKAFDDLGLRQQRFAGLVLSILILEDILAIVLMVMLSTMAVSQNVTENTANLLASYINAIRADVSVKREYVRRLVEELFPAYNVIAQAQLQQLTMIQINTAKNVEFVEEIRDILHRNINGVNKFNI